MDAGCQISERTTALLNAIAAVTVVTNSRLLQADFFQRITVRPDEAFVVFNRHRFVIDTPLASRVIWVHRLDEASGTYFGDTDHHDAIAAQFHHIYVGVEPSAAATLPAAASYLSYRSRLPGLADYPVGKRTLALVGKVPRILSPSTGFVVFAWLRQLQRRGLGFRLRAVGVGREYGGWPGHDWGFERQMLSQSGIDFRTPEGFPDRCYGTLDRIPYGVLRAVGKLRELGRRAA